MHIKHCLALMCALCFSPNLVWSQEIHAGHDAHNPQDHRHGAERYHAFTLETDYGGSEHGALVRWDLDGWIGTDENKLWLKAEGEKAQGTTESAEFWALYSRNVSEFWDVQAGLRHDSQPHPTSYGVLGLQGLLPLFFETQAHVFVSDEGDVSARVHTETDLLVTQRLILQPHAEINLFAQDVPEQDVGAGLSNGEIGVQTRYELSRQFAPYMDFTYERAFGETSAIAKREEGDNDNAIVSVGLRVMF